MSRMEETGYKAELSFFFIVWYTKNVKKFDNGLEWNGFIILLFTACIPCMLNISLSFIFFSCTQGCDITLMKLFRFCTQVELT